jgi:hypothetical protein
MKNSFKTSCLLFATSLMPVVAQAQMQPVSYEGLSQITGQALPTGRVISVDIGQDKSKGLSFSLDPTGSGSFGMGPSKTKTRDVSYLNTVTGAGVSYDGGRAKNHGFTFSWTAPTVP